MGGSKEPEVTQIPTKSPQQEAFLNMLLGGMKSYIGQDPFGQMPTLGERYGGGRTGRAPSGTTSPPMLGGGGKGGTTPGGMAFGGERSRPERLEGRSMIRPVPERANVLDELLTGPFTEPFTQGQTGNYPKRRR